MKKVLILAYSVINRDPRVLKQIAFFEKEGFAITLSSLGYEGFYPHYPMAKPKSTFFRIIKAAILLLRFKRGRVSDFIYHSSFEDLKSEIPFFDLIVANDSETWPLAAHLKEIHPGTKVIFDAHEFYPLHFEDNFRWKYLHKEFQEYVCRNYIPKSDCLLTVCTGIGEAYKKEFGKEALVVMNTPEYHPHLKPFPVKEKIKLIHHGTANRSRKIEKMIELMDYLDDRFHLSLMLMPTDPSYLIQLKTLAKGKNINFLEPVSTKEITAFINHYDIGLFLLEPVNFNYTHALPNKFFEFIQARLAIAIGPSPEMKQIVEAHKLGVVAEDFETKNLADKINLLTKEKIMEYKSNSDKVAELYSSNQNEKIFKELLEKIYPNP